MRFFIELSYNGKNFFGWQIQKEVNTIEKNIEYCLSKLLKKKINIIGAGRTDKGVHAKQMFAHFDYDNKIKSNFLLKRLNLFLPKSIKVKNIFHVKNNVHARFNAIKRIYKYYIINEKNPFNQDFSWYCFYSLNINKMNIASKILMNYKDFSSFCKKKNKVKMNNNNCIIYRSFWKKKDKYLCFTIEANRFLRSMVRSIIGTIVDVGRGKITIKQFTNIIKSKNFNYCSPLAPSHGLFLTKILYPKNIFL
ncbi:tRNA pseudouridine(38-40) synthase TruA [Blattabacterium cuenoti]|uniref:tRNA pseudouridine(38-40) synthase TruA n=1 Tax=Blattabacterium cuenoti TaxID=1653831 RepID=UPI00163CAFA9|nr:tRNA pseudouridine(38-40) synthase TruA [Blattabacterium cuenoti]